MPTPEQETLFWKSAGTARWAYNYYLSEKERIYQTYLQNGKTGKKNITSNKIRKYINNVLKKTTHQWLKEVGSNVMKQGVRDADDAYQKYFKGLTCKPKLKSKRKSKISFYVNYETLTRKQGGFHGEKIGFVKTSEALPKISKNQRYSNPRISYDGKYWYLSFCYEVQERQNIKLSNDIIGIDLGIKNLAIVSNGTIFKNINKTNRMKKLERKLKREQRKASKKLKSNISGYSNYHKPIYKCPLEDCKNLNKQYRKIKILYRRISNIRNNYLHQITRMIVKTKPSCVVMENLNINGMMKNRRLAKAILNQKFYEFKRQMRYKCKEFKIKFIEADRFYPSSKKCSQCGHIKNDLKLKDRIYKCTECGLVIDRDLNAAINLANYEKRS